MTNSRLATRSPATSRGPLPMTTGRRVALAIGVPLAVASIGWTALTAVAWAGQGSYRVNLRIPTHSNAVTVAVDSGQVSLRQGTAGLVRVTGIARYALVRSSVTWRSTLAGASVQSRCRQLLAGPCSFDYRVTVPAGAATHISDAAGDLTAHGLTGPITLQAESGNIGASALTGDVSISDQSGDITVADLSGRNLVIKDQSGNISAAGLTVPGVTVTNRSGDITLTFASVPARVRVTGESGDVTLVLPPGSTAYRVNAHTSSGATDIRVPTRLSSSHVITVADGSGDISITQ